MRPLLVSWVDDPSGCRSLLNSCDFRETLSNKLKSIIAQTIEHSPSVLDGSLVIADITGNPPEIRCLLQ